MKKTSLLASFAFIIAFAGLAWTLTVNPASNVTGDSAATAETIVYRDTSANFAAGTITASLTGNVSGNLAGMATITAKTKANFNALDPVVAGEVYFCSDCTVKNLCVSTGTSVAQWMRVDDSTKGCGSNE